MTFHCRPCITTIAVSQVVQTYLQRASDEEVNKFIKQRYFMHLANQIALYPGSEPLVVALENLALRGPTLAAMPPLMAMIAKAAATEPNVARPIVSFITDVIAKVGWHRLSTIQRVRRTTR